MSVNRVIQSETSTCRPPAAPDERKGGGRLPERCRYSYLKTPLDFLAAVALLLLTAPLLLLVAAVVKLTSRGPVIYAQTRLGLYGRAFTIYKIRTMVHDCESTSGACWSTTNDPRITPVGRFLRRTHLDELPQLWNVLRGDMSLIGPRPERPEFVTLLEQEIPRYRERLLVRPGLTGLAQVQLPPDTDLDSVRRKLKYDLYYVYRLGALLDLIVLLGTPLHSFGVPASLYCKLLRLPDWPKVERAIQLLESPLATDTSAEGLCLQAEPA